MIYDTKTLKELLKEEIRQHKNLNKMLETEGFRRETEDKIKNLKHILKEVDKIKDLKIYMHKIKF